MGQEAEGILEDSLLVNAWDPWSMVGNGNAADNSLDGYFGRCTAMALLCWPKKCPHPVGSCVMASADREAAERGIGQRVGTGGRRPLPKPQRLRLVEGEEPPRPALPRRRLWLGR